MVDYLPEKWNGIKLGNKLIGTSLFYGRCAENDGQIIGVYDRTQIIHLSNLVRAATNAVRDNNFSLGED